MTTDEYYLDIASAVAKKSTCLKKHYGAVLAKNSEIIATGFNGTPRHEEHCTICTKVDCNKDMAEYSTCPAVHAEMNVIISSARQEMIGSTLYLAGQEAESNEELAAPCPCEICLRLIKNAGIDRVITRAGIIYTRDQLTGRLVKINK